MSRGKGAPADAKAKGKGAKGKGKAKGAKGKKGGGDEAAAPARPRGRLVQNHYVALAGLTGLGLIAVMMLRGQLDLLAGSERAGVLFGVVLLVERLLLPLCRALVGPPGPPPSAPAQAPEGAGLPR